MTREEVIRGLECIRNWAQFTVKHGWIVGGASEKMVKYAEDALTLLKTQAAVEPKLIGIYYVCGQCGMRTVGQHKAQNNDMLKISNYCPECGRAVKWE